jgi:hypothetical protein
MTDRADDERDSAKKASQTEAGQEASRGNTPELHDREEDSQYGGGGDHGGTSAGGSGGGGGGDHTERDHGARK